MRTIQISDETYENIKDQLSVGFITKEIEKLEINSYEDFIGKSFFFRTLTYHWVGRVIKKVGSLFQLEDASWVADSGRFMNAIKDGTLSEVEPVGTVFLNIESCTDIIPWNHPLPNSQK